MKKKESKPASYRLPKALLGELKEVSEKTEISQTKIVQDGIQLRLKTLKARLARREEVAVPA